MTNILGGDRSAKACTYQYPYQTVQEFVLFCQLCEFISFYLAVVAGWSAGDGRELGPRRGLCLVRGLHRTFTRLTCCMLPSVTRFGESGVYGFLPHLDSRPSAQILLQSITTEARQQLIFRQFQGLPPFPVDFETGIPQSYAWTLLSPYIKSCPKVSPNSSLTRRPMPSRSKQTSAIRA